VLATASPPPNKMTKDIDHSNSLLLAGYKYWCRASCNTATREKESISSPT